VSIILNIDTAVQTASVCLADGEIILGEKINPVQKDSAAWLHMAIKELLADHKILLKDVKAIAISEGPGSYTGLRVGMAAAKGLCYALEIPLITISTLKMMAAAALDIPADLYCPMIDARRMEVFTAVYDNALKEIINPHNLILKENSFEELLEKNRIIFFGDGSEKLRPLIQHLNADFQPIAATARHMVTLSLLRHNHSMFSDLAYSEPYYGKDFHSSSIK